MPLKPKTTRREHSSEQLAVILALNERGFSYADIGAQIDVPKSTVGAIVQRALLNPNAAYGKQSHPGRPSKLDARPVTSLFIMSKRTLKITSLPYALPQSQKNSCLRQLYDVTFKVPAI